MIEKWSTNKIMIMSKFHGKVQAYLWKKPAGGIERGVNDK